MIETAVFCPNWIGDVILSTPAIRLLHRLRRGPGISCIVARWCSEVLEGNPCVAEVITHQASARASVGDHIRLWRHLRGNKPRSAYLFHRSFARALLLKLAGTGEITGYSAGMRRFLLTRAVEEPARQVHRAEHFLRLAATGAGAGDTESLVSEELSRGCDFPVSEHDRESALKLLSKAGIAGGRFALISPGGNWMPKRWHPAGFAALCDGLLSKMELVPVLCGGRDDVPLCSDVESLAKERVVNLCGRTTLKEYAAMAGFARVVVTNDSAPMHIAASVGARLVALFGPTSPSVTGPLMKGRGTVIQKNNCRSVPCHETKCDSGECMKSIAAGDVMQAVEQVTKNDK